MMPTGPVGHGMNNDSPLTTRWQQLARTYPVFARLSPALQELVQANIQPVEAPPGYLLFDEASPCSLFLLVFTGSVRVVKPAPSGREILLYRVEPGDNCVLTVSCLLGREPYPARGVVDEPLTGCIIAQPIFDRLLAESAIFRSELFRYFGARIVDLMQLVEEVAFGALDQRLAALLVERGPRLELTHQQLADELGTVREIVTRLLHRFERDGLVELSRESIAIKDSAGLRTLAAGQAG